MEERIAPQGPDLRRREDEYTAGQLADCTFNARGERCDESAAREYVVFCRRCINPDGLHVATILSGVDGTPHLLRGKSAIDKVVNMRIGIDFGTTRIVVAAAVRCTCV